MHSGGSDHIRFVPSNWRQVSALPPNALRSPLTPASDCWESSPRSLFGTLAVDVTGVEGASISAPNERPRSRALPQGSGARECSHSLVERQSGKIASRVLIRNQPVK